MSETVKAAIVQLKWTGDKDSMIEAHVRQAREAAAEEPELFDLDEASIERRSALQDMAEEEPAPETGGRGGLFTINKLIHRVAGTGGRVERREPEVPAAEDDGAELPAFLRRQAN